jgi:PAS domain S-box-containing protein
LSEQPVSKPRLGLKARLMGAFALLAVAPTLLLGSLAIRSARHDVEAEVIRGNLALIRAIGRELNGTLQDTRRALSVSAAAWAQGPSPDRAKRILRGLRSEFAILRQVTLLDPQGRRLHGDQQAKGERVSLELANTFGGYVSEVLFSGDKRKVLMVVQARDRKGELAGFLAAVVDLGFVQQRLSEARLGPGATLLVVDGEGRKVAASGDLPALPWGPGQRANNPAVDRVMATHTEGHLELDDRRQRRWVAVYRNIVGMNEFRGVRWGVMLLQPTSEAYALARKTTRDTVLVAILVLLVALAAGAWLASRITKPLASLVRQTELVAAENFEVALVPRAGSDEIGVLARSFASMVQRLRVSRDKLYGLTEFQENLVRAIPVGVISVDGAGVVRSVNPAQERLSGVSAEEILGRPLDAVFPAQRGDPADMLGQLRRVLERGTPTDQTLDATPTPFTRTTRARFRARMAPLRNRQGEVDGAVILQEDLSERARLEAQLIHSEKLSSVGVLAAGVAHEINNPLTTILGYAKLLLEDRGEDDPDRDALELVADEAKRVQEIVRNLLDFSRQETGEIVPGSLNDLIERTLNLAAPDLRKRGIEVQLELDRDLPLALVDGRRIEQVFVNLVTNASHAMGAGGGTLTVSSGADPARPGAVFASFADSGPGIPAENRRRILDPFFTTKDPGEGTGLGLAISQRIVTDHGGEIEIESPATGAAFRIWLPSVDEDEREGG